MKIMCVDEKYYCAAVDECKVSFEKLAEMKDWLNSVMGVPATYRDTRRGAPHWRWSAGYSIFWFTTERDRTLFILRWS